MPKVTVVVEVPEDLKVARLAMVMAAGDMEDSGRNPRCFDDASDIYGLIQDEVDAGRFVEHPLTIETGDPEGFYKSLIDQRVWLEKIVAGLSWQYTQEAKDAAEGLLNLLTTIQDVIEPEEDPDGAEE
jgi:hypothetical protein